MATALNNSPTSSPTVTLGKRKRSKSTTSLVLHLSGGSCSSETDDKSTYSCTSDDNSDPESTTSPHIPSRRRNGKSTAIIVNGKLCVKSKSIRKFACTFDGCTKSYTKPSRLEEHERSHTGEVCNCIHERIPRSHQTIIASLHMHS